MVKTGKEQEETAVYDLSKSIINNLTIRSLHIVYVLTDKLRATILKPFITQVQDYQNQRWTSH